MRPGLAALLYPFPAEKFLARYWAHKPLALHGRKKGIHALLNHPRLKSLDELLNHWPTSVTASLPDYNDEYSSISISSFEARKLYSNGMPLSFSTPERYFAGLSDWREAIQADLGLGINAPSSCSIYCTPNGRGTDPHYDLNSNFVVQLRGTKRWKLAMNKHVQAPVHRHVMGTDAEAELLEHCDKQPLPASMPKDSIEVELRPGSVLYVPRGVWHSTSAEGDTLALNFIFRETTWIDLVLEGIGQKLRRHPAWRGLADGVGSSDIKRRKSAVARLDKLLERLPTDLAPLDAASILRNVEPSSASYERSLNARFRMRGTELTLSLPQGSPSVLQLDPVTALIIRWIAKTNSPFTIRELLDATAAQLKVSEIKILLDSLMQLGAINKTENY